MCEATIDLHDHQYLPNGALILLERDGRPASEGRLRTTIVLAKTTKDFVVWVRVHPEDKPSFCIAGDYCGNDLRAALDEWESRQG